MDEEPCPCWVDKMVVRSSPELSQTQPQNMLPSLMVILDLNNRIPRWRTQERFIFCIEPPWKTSVVHCLGCVETQASYGWSWSYSSWEPCWCPWSVLPPKVIQCSWSVSLLDMMLISLDHAATEGYDSVHRLCWGRALCWCPWPVLPPKSMLRPLMLETMWISMVCAKARHHLEVHDPCFCWL